MRKLKIVLLTSGILLLLMVVALFFAFKEFLYKPNDGDVAPDMQQAPSDSNSNGGGESGASKVVLTPSDASKNLLYQKGADGASYVVKGIGLCTDTDIIIPDTCNGYPVVAIDVAAFKDNRNITSVVVGANVTSIAESAFLNCTRLTSVTLPDGLKALRTNAFGGCVSIKSLVIPSSVTSISAGALNDTAIVDLTFPIANLADIEYLFCSDITHHTPTTLKTLTVTSGTTVPAFFFSSASSITSISLPHTVTIIDTSAFVFCYLLESITVDENNTVYRSVDGNLYTKDMKTIVKYAIGRTEPSFTLPSSVTDIGTYAFYSVKNLTSITIPNTVKTIHYGAFMYSSITSVDIPDSVTTIKNSAFYQCNSLLSVTIGMGVNRIEENAFSDCQKLDSVVFMNKNGWMADQYEITPAELEDPATAAAYLDSPYGDNVWTRT